MHRMLTQALRAAIGDGADEEVFGTARAAAQIVGLPGLAAALAALEARPHRNERSRPLVQRLVELGASETLAELRAADGELKLLAEALGGSGESGGDSAVPSSTGADDAGAADEAPPEGTLSVAEALVELPLGGKGVAELAARVRLAEPVAAALRAALEWMIRDVERPRPFRLRVEDSALEVSSEGVLPSGLAGIHDVLAAAEGNLASLGDTGLRSGAAGTWVVRVPTWSERPLHLMFEQGSLRLALPWHAVLRVSLVPSIEIEMRGGALATPLVPSLAPLEQGIGERPVIAIAHGIQRGLVVADRLVWRLGAEACEPLGPAPVAALRHAVRTDDGEVFWVAEPGVLLASPSLPAPPQDHAPRVAAPAPPPPPAPPPAPPPPPVEEEPELLVLAAEDVEPLVLTAAQVEPLEIAAPAVAPPATPPQLLPEWLERFGSAGTSPSAGLAGPEAAVPAEPRPEAPAILIAEDSIAAQHFLARLFEQRGFASEIVASAAELRTALARRSWSLVCVDVELPDAGGEALLTEVTAALAERETPCVALVRDDEDVERAAAAGVRRWLRKPFDRDELAKLLTRLGLVGAEAR
jgi:CheY-like chemotaxis protein